MGLFSMFKKDMKKENTIDKTEQVINRDFPINRNEYCGICKKNAVKIFPAMNLSCINLSVQEYNDRIDNCYGIYCSNCDFNVCYACLSTLNSISDITNGEETDPLLIYKKHFPHSKSVILYCPSCKTQYGDLHKDFTKNILEILEKARDHSLKDQSLADISSVIHDVLTLISTLEKRSLLKERVNDLKEIFEIIVSHLGVQKSFQEANNFVDQMHYNDAVNTLNQCLQWTKLLKNKNEFSEDIKKYIKAIEEVESPVINISVKELEKALKKIS